MHNDGGLLGADKLRGMRMGKFGTIYNDIVTGGTKGIEIPKSSNISRGTMSVPTMGCGHMTCASSPLFNSSRKSLS